MEVCHYAAAAAVDTFTVVRQMAAAILVLVAGVVRRLRNALVSNHQTLVPSDRRWSSVGHAAVRTAEVVEVLGAAVEVLGAAVMASVAEIVVAVVLGAVVVGEEIGQ